MSLPPVTVHIKRKATDEPVDYFHVRESNGGRKRRQTDFVYTREVEPPNNEPTSSPAADPVRRIKQLPKSSSSQSLGAQCSSKSQTQDAGALGLDIKENINAGQPGFLANIITQSSAQNAASKQQPRRFHLSRSASTTPSTTPALPGRSQKRPALFVEHRPRKRVSPTASSSPLTPELTSQPKQASVLKKPGQAARIPAATTKSTPRCDASQLSPQPRDVRLPSGMIAPWSLDDQQLVEEMQRYTLQEIGHSIAEADATTKPGGSPASTPSKKPSKFKPKVPKLRYHERHPEEFAHQHSSMDVDEFIEDVDDESEYIIDTYIRVPVDAMELDTDTEKKFGFLVLDGQEDVDEFYSAETESDDDEDYDEEDENAENHYTADYPDEEVDSDDEYDRNPYQYANDDDAAFSDDSIEGTKFPWSKKPAWLRKAEHGSDDKDDDEDD